MKFYDYLESVYATSNIETQKNYSAFGHAETQAIADLTNAHRKIFKFLAYFKVVFNYFLVLSSIKKKPEDSKAIIQRMNDENVAAAKAKEELRAKREKTIKIVPDMPQENGPA